MASDVYTTVDIYSKRNEPCAVEKGKPLLAIIAGVTKFNMTGFSWTNTTEPERLHFDPTLTDFTKMPWSPNAPTDEEAKNCSMTPFVASSTVFTAIGSGIDIYWAYKLVKGKLSMRD